MVLAASIAGFLAFGGMSQAATCTAEFGNKNDPQTTKYVLDAALSAVCVDKDNDDVDEILAIYAGGPWTLTDKNDNDGPVGSVFFSDAPVNNTQGGGTDGNWGINAFPLLTQIVIVLKAGNTFGAFLLQPAAVTGTWSADRNLSHASIYVRSCTVPAEGCNVAPPVGEVPVPAAGLLLAGGLGLMGLLRRRRSN